MVAAITDPWSVDLDRADPVWICARGRGRCAPTVGGRARRAARLRREEPRDLGLDRLHQHPPGALAQHGQQRIRPRLPLLAAAARQRYPPHGVSYQGDLEHHERRLPPPCHPYQVNLQRIPRPGDRRSRTQAFCRQRLAPSAHAQEHAADQADCPPSDAIIVQRSARQFQRRACSPIRQGQDPTVRCPASAIQCTEKSGPPETIRKGPGTTRRLTPRAGSHRRGHRSGAELTPRLGGPTNWRKRCPTMLGS